MKKGILALAVLGAFSGAAFAQSSVTLYGVLDIGYQYNKGGVDTGREDANGNAIYEKKGTSGIDGGHQSGNRWGLRGSEDLGGGLKGVFTLESGFSLDTGMSAQGNRLFGRQAWLGLQSGWGTVALGRMATFSSGTGSFDMFGRTDPFLTGFGVANLGNTFLSASALRADNSIAYQSPTWAGFKFGAGYSLNASGSESFDRNQNNKVTFLGANWTGGPFFVVVTYDAVNAAGTNPNQKHLQVGATWDIGPVRLHGGYADLSKVQRFLQPSGVGPEDSLTLPADLAYDAQAWMLGLTWTISSFKVFGSYQQSNAKNVIYQGQNFEPDYDVWGIGATYNFSRRTNLYASWAQRSGDGTLNSSAFDRDQFALGVRHLF